MRVTNFITVGKDELTSREWKQLFADLKFRNADGDDVECWRYLRDEDAYRFPRGIWNYLPDDLEVEDRRSLPTASVLRYRSEPREGQREAVQAILEREQGIVMGDPGTGKTDVALSAIAKLGTTALVLTHTTDILDQWKDRIAKRIPDIEVGEIRGQTEEIGHLTLCTVQTFHKRVLANPQRYRRMFGAVFADECHHAPADSWEVILNSLAAYYRIGLTATASRADGLGPLIRLLIGPKLVHMRSDPSFPTTVEFVKTNFQFNYRGAFDWQRLLAAIEDNRARNRLIAKRADEEIRAGNRVLILSRRIQHLANISEEMEEDHEYLVGQFKREERKEILEEFRRGDSPCLLATQLADEALDVPAINRVLLTFPGKHDGRIIQQAGRALREHKGKTDAKIIDFVDDRVKPLRRQWMERTRAYNSMPQWTIEKKRRLTWH